MTGAMSPPNSLVPIENAAPHGTASPLAANLDVVVTPFSIPVPMATILGGRPPSGRCQGTHSRSNTAAALNTLSSAPGPSPSEAQDYEELVRSYLALCAKVQETPNDDWIAILLNKSDTNDGADSMECSDAYGSPHECSLMSGTYSSGCTGLAVVKPISSAARPKITASSSTAPTPANSTPIPRSTTPAGKRTKSPAVARQGTTATRRSGSVGRVTSLNRPSIFGSQQQQPPLQVTSTRSSAVGGGGERANCAKSVIRYCEHFLRPLHQRMEALLNRRRDVEISLEQFLRIASGILSANANTIMPDREEDDDGNDVRRSTTSLHLRSTRGGGGKTSTATSSPATTPRKNSSVSLAITTPRATVFKANRLSEALQELQHAIVLLLLSLSDAKARACAPLGISGPTATGNTEARDVMSPAASPIKAKSRSAKSVTQSASSPLIPPSTSSNGMGDFLKIPFFSLAAPFSDTDAHPVAAALPVSSDPSGSLRFATFVQVQETKIVSQLRDLCTRVQEVLAPTSTLSDEGVMVSASHDVLSFALATSTPTIVQLEDDDMLATPLFLPSKYAALLVSSISQNDTAMPPPPPPSSGKPISTAKSSKSTLKPKVRKRSSSRGAGTAHTTSPPTMAITGRSSPSSTPRQRNFAPFFSVLHPIDDLPTHRSSSTCSAAATVDAPSTEVLILHCGAPSLLALTQTPRRSVENSIVVNQASDRWEVNATTTGPKVSRSTTAGKRVSNRSNSASTRSGVSAAHGRHGNSSINGANGLAATGTLASSSSFKSNTVSGTAKGGKKGSVSTLLFNSQLAKAWTTWESLRPPTGSTPLQDEEEEEDLNAVQFSPRPSSGGTNTAATAAGAERYRIEVFPPVIPTEDDASPQPGGHSPSHPSPLSAALMAPSPVNLSGTQRTSLVLTDAVPRRLEMNDTQLTDQTTTQQSKSLIDTDSSSLAASSLAVSPPQLTHLGQSLDHEKETVIHSSAEDDAVHATHSPLGRSWKQDDTLQAVSFVLRWWRAMRHRRATEAANRATHQTESDRQARQLKEACVRRFLWTCVCRRRMQQRVRKAREAAGAAAAASVMLAQTGSVGRNTAEKNATAKAIGSPTAMTSRERFQRAKEQRKMLRTTASTTAAHSPTSPSPHAIKLPVVAPLPLAKAGISALAIHQYRESSNFTVSAMHRLLRAPPVLLYATCMAALRYPTLAPMAYLLPDNEAQRQQSTPPPPPEDRGDVLSSMSLVKGNAHRASVHATDKGNDADTVAWRKTGVCHIPFRSLRNYTCAEYEAIICGNGANGGRRESAARTYEESSPRRSGSRSQMTTSLPIPRTMRYTSYVIPNELQRVDPIVKPFHRPFEHWGMAHSLTARVFCAAAIYAWQLIFSHTPFDNSKQQDLSTREEQQARLERVADRNSIIMDCYGVHSEREWIRCAMKDLSFVGQISVPNYPRDTTDSEHEGRANYDFVKNFLFQCFPNIEELDDIQSYLVGAGIFFLLKEVFHCTRTSVSSRKMVEVAQHLIVGNGIDYLTRGLQCSSPTLNTGSMSPTDAIDCPQTLDGISGFQLAALQRYEQLRLLSQLSQTVKRGSRSSTRTTQQQQQQQQSTTSEVATSSVSVDPTASTAAPSPLKHCIAQKRSSGSLALLQATPNCTDSQSIFASTIQTTEMVRKTSLQQDDQKTHERESKSKPEEAEKSQLLLVRVPKRSFTAAMKEARSVREYEETQSKVLANIIKQAELASTSAHWPLDHSDGLDIVYPPKFLVSLSEALARELFGLDLSLGNCEDLDSVW